MKDRRAEEEHRKAEPQQGDPNAPVDEGFASLDARVRYKMEMRQPLAEEERAFFARIPGSKELSPKDVQDTASDVEHQ